MLNKEIALRSDGSAKLITYVLDPEISFRLRKKRPAIIVCPGGAYLTLATKEGEAVAARWLGLGYSVFVLKYIHYFEKRPGEAGDEPVINPASRPPEQLIDLMRAMEIIHSQVDEWGIDESRIYVMGFSAGAHLALTLATRFDDGKLLDAAGTVPPHAKPAGIVAGYPMITAKALCNREQNDYPMQMRPLIGYIQRAIYGGAEPDPAQTEWMDLVSGVRPDMPRTFIWHSTEDTVVDPLETMEFTIQMLRQGVECELHMYQSGPHGTALCDSTTASSDCDIVPGSAAWVEAAYAWLEKDGTGGLKLEHVQ